MSKKDIEILPIYFDYVMETDYPVYILVGGRNSGKTHFMGQEAVYRMNTCEDYKLLVVEDVETNINEGVKTNILERIEDFEQSPLFEDTKQPAKIKHKANNNITLFHGYHRKKQQKKVKSLNAITAAWYEEAENITYEQFKALRMQLRGGNPDDRILYLTMNPVNQDGFINDYFFKQKPDKVFEEFADGRPKVFEKSIEVNFKRDGEQKNINIDCMVIVTTYRDNPYLTDLQIADIIELKETRPDLYEMLANGKFIKPEGALIKEFQKFSLDRLDLAQSDRMTAIVDTASSGSDSATLGIYAKYEEDEHYLVAGYKDDRDADVVIPIMASMINKFEPQTVKVEKNHEGLYFHDQLNTKTKKKIKVDKFHSVENKHEKILSQSGRMKMDLYIRDDADEEYNDFIKEAGDYNKDEKENDKDDCIDNIAMYFKHGSSFTPMIGRV